MKIEMDCVTKTQIAFWGEEIDSLLHNPPEDKGVAANQLFAAATSFLVCTRNFTHVPDIKEGRRAVCGIIRRLVAESNLHPSTHELALGLLEPNVAPPRNPSAVA